MTASHTVPDGITTGTADGDRLPPLAPATQGRHPTGLPGMDRSPVDYAQRPMLVFWETTRACLLACRHCRASATPDALPGELTGPEGFALVDQVAGFGRPYPILVLTGGDCLLRPDLFDIVAYATSLGVPVALSPSVTPNLTPAAISRIAGSGVKAVSISLDGAVAATHDGVRGVPGHFDQTVAAIRDLVAAGLTVQINTTVMRANVTELADVAALITKLGAHIWEVFFLVPVGRGVATGAVTPDEHEQVAHFLYDTARYGVIVRTVEAPFFRRVVATRRAGGPAPDSLTPPEAFADPAAGAGDATAGTAGTGVTGVTGGAVWAARGALYHYLRVRLRALLGPPTHRPSAHTAATRDGKGILFVAHDGEVYPAGFLPLALGNVRDRPLAAIYRDDPLLQKIRAAAFTGRCGRCEYADLCGGSRARAFAHSGDPLGEDPACPYLP